MKTDFPGTDEVRRSHTQKFLTQYLLGNVLHGKASASSKTDADYRQSSLMQSIHPYSGDIRIGDVRLLSQTEGIKYVLVLAKRGWNYLTIPYSEYDAPATDGELKLPRSGGAYLNVLQVWNARTIHYFQLRESWLIAELTPDEMKIVRAVRAALLLGKAPPAEVAKLTGMPILRSDDLRMQYLKRAVAQFADIDRRDFVLMRTIIPLEQSASERSYPVFADFSVKMAAAGERNLLSMVVDASLYTVEEILQKLSEAGHVGWRQQIPAEMLSAQPESVWCWETSDASRHAPVVFYDRKRQQLLGGGEMCGNMVYLRNRGEIDSAPLPDAQDIVILIGKEQ